MVKYFVNIEDTYMHTYSSNKKVLMKCPDCGYKKEMQIHALYRNGIACPQCGDGISYSEKFIFNLLKQLKNKNKLNNFIWQYKKSNNEWCDKYKYDFYFEKNNEKYIIEVHGLQHYKDNTNFKMSLKEVQENDKNKKNYLLKMELNQKIT